ncbi:hypothetical protein ACFPN7_07550 [Amycolatopsis halotolerans]|uniref:hypothetical protein n=1 Tax=Amycolatopsis halotolerans TaxID=330083 RepID=UPI0036232D74
MKGLLLRLSAVDSGAETAVRVIAYFDELIARRATLPDLLRATAFLAECVAGIRCVDGTVLRFRPTGEPGGDGPVPPGAVVVDLDGAGRVWLERAGEPGPLDVLVLERLAISAKVLNPVEPQPAAPHLADPALVELVLGEQAADEDRTRALTLLGLDTTRPLRVVAVASGPAAMPARTPSPSSPAAARSARGWPSSAGWPQWCCSRAKAPIRWFRLCARRWRCGPRTARFQTPSGSESATPSTVWRPGVRGCKPAWPNDSRRSRDR